MVQCTYRLANLSHRVPADKGEWSPLGTDDEAAVTLNHCEGKKREELYDWRQCCKGTWDSAGYPIAGFSALYSTGPSVAL